MSETKQGLRKTTLSLIDEAEENHAFYVDEVLKASNEQSALKERGEILKLAIENTRSKGAQAIIQTMITEIRGRIIVEERRQSDCESKKKYYSEVKRALNEAIKDYKQL